MYSIHVFITSHSLQITQNEVAPELMHVICFTSKLQVNGGVSPEEPDASYHGEVFKM